MSLDTTTESIAHFIGLFEMAVEEARLRKEYTEFTALKAKEAEAAEFEFGPVKIKAPFRLEDYNPNVRYVPKPDAPPVGPAPMLPESIPLQGPYVATGAALPPLDPGQVFDSHGGVTTILPFVPIPSSAITITLQTIILHDDDSYGDMEEAGFLPVEIFHAQLEAAIALAEQLTPWSHGTLAQDILNDPTAAVEFLDHLDAIVAPGVHGASISIVADDAAYAIHVDGEAVEDLPEFDDLLPAYIKAKRDAEKEEEALEEAADDLAGHSKGKPSLFETHEGLIKSFANSGHNVVAGANEAHNAVDIHTSWIDAGVIAVGGDVINLNAIAQINILSDHNYVNGHAQSGGLGSSNAHNIASMVVNQLQDDSEDDAVGAPVGFPVTWNMVHYEGDVTVTNFIKQFTFATDNDQLNLTFTANSTAIVTGENLTYNIAHAGEFGFGYDLIIVGGSMVSLNLINQTNVLLDDDYFSGEGLGWATISDGDNLLYNEASITTDGADTQIDMLQEFKDALQSLADGATDLAQAVVNSPLFQGLEALKVLYIEGDLTQMNIVDQVNYLGDQDQVHMAQDAMLSALDQAPVSITTGSNLMTNTAAILSTGYDSQVMADGDYYNDALLYQAELIDTDADPLGVSVTQLASEAVAFLADDMVATSISEKLEAAGLDHDAHTGGTTLDVMQTMTA